MRKLLIMRGFQGVGKSTLLRELGLSDYLLCADDIRSLFSSPELLEQGKWCISHENEVRVWKFLFERLEERMSLGQFVVIDAMHLQSKAFQEYIKLAQKYFYKIACMDFKNFPIEQALINNQNRAIHRRIPDSVIIECQKKALSSDIPKGIKHILWQGDLSHLQVLKQWLNATPISLNQYRKIHHIGDLQGCFEGLSHYVKDGIQEDEYYIFVGDYFDRGRENGELAQWLLAHCERENIKLLWGNHESILADDLQGKEIDDPYYLAYTRAELNKAGLSTQSLEHLLNHIDDLLIYEYQGKIVYCTHGGIDAISEQLHLLNGHTLYSGVGNFSYDVDLHFENWIKDQQGKYDHCYQVHGHKNASMHLIDEFEHSFNLEGNVEFGGELRIVTLSAKGFEHVEIKNQSYYRIFQRIPTFYSFIPHWTKTTEFKQNVDMPMQAYLPSQKPKLLAYIEQLQLSKYFPLCLLGVIQGKQSLDWQIFEQLSQASAPLAFDADQLTQRLLEIGLSLGKQKRLKRDLCEFKAYFLVTAERFELIAMLDEALNKSILASDLKQYLKNYKWPIFEEKSKK